MSLTPPNYIERAGFIGAPVKYKWNSDIGLTRYAAKDQNVRLYHAVDEANFKAKIALTVSITEWIVWRFQGHTDLTDAILRIEAAWASAIDPLYVEHLSHKMTHDDDREPVQGPLELALCVLGDANKRYAAGSIYLAEQVVKQAMLARHLSPDKKLFEDWLSETVRRLATIFPRQAKYDRKTGTYDASHEKPVPREFFDSKFVYTDAAADVALRSFLQALDPGQNPYLRSAEEMKAHGFVGIPYTR